MVRLNKWILLLAVSLPVSAAAQTSLSGSGLIIKSRDATTLATPGYLGTYLVVPTGGSTVNFTIGASGQAGAPSHMNLAVADSRFGFNISDPAAQNYTTPNTFLPAGTYFIRTERDYIGNPVGSGSFSLNSLSVNTVSGNVATFANASSDGNALAAANTYIQNFRKGPANIALTGPGNIPLLAGTQVGVDLKRHAFNFGTAVPGNNVNGVNSFLSSTGQFYAGYTPRLLQNFNSVVPENAGKWSNNESWVNNNFANDVQTTDNIDKILTYARDNNMRARMHNVIWGNQQPSLVNAYLTNGSAGSLTALRNEISERVDYYTEGYINGVVNPTNQRADRFVEVDVYNESWHTGVNTAGSNNYWDRYGVSGIAAIHQEVIQGIQAAGSTAKVFVNEYNVLQDGGSAYATWYFDHIRDIRDAGFAGGMGDVVQGVGIQYYPNTGIGTADSQHSPRRIMQVLQNFSVQGLATALTEFGAKSGGSEATAATILDDTVRLMFGTADSTGFTMWGFWSSPTQGVNLFQPGSAFYVGPDFTITESGKRWQDLLGIQDWDGNPNNAWDTLLTATVNPDGTIDFTGFYGDYNIGNQAGFSNLTLAKGTGQYQLTLAAPPQWSSWNTSNSGSWSSAANWTSGGIADAVGQTAYFGPTGAAKSITVDGARTIGMLAFNSASPYTIGGSAITLDGPAGIAAIYVADGSHTIDSPMVVNDDLHVTVVTAGSMIDLVAPLSAPSHAIRKFGAGAMQVNTVDAAELDVAGGVIRVSAKPQANDQAARSDVTSLVVEPGAQFDLTNNAARVGNPIEEVRAMLFDARLTSSAASVTRRLGYAASGGEVDIEFTFAGDANLDQQVDITDLGLLATAWQSTGFWSGGDFDYNGFIDITDLGMLATNWQAGVGGLGEALASLGLPIAAVPEPGAVAIVLVACQLLRRNRLPLV